MLVIKNIVKNIGKKNVFIEKNTIKNMVRICVHIIKNTATAVISIARALLNAASSAKGIKPEMIGPRNTPR